MATVQSLDTRLIAAEKAITKLQSQVAGLLTQASALDARIKTLEANASWRVPLIALHGLPLPVTQLKSVYVTWAQTKTGAVIGTVSVSLDGGAKVSPAPSPFTAQSLKPGDHRLDYFVGNVSTPELTHHWTILA